MALKDLPIEDLPFTEIIDDNYLYADKTRYIYQLLLRQKGQFFLSRPRRFGKSLLLDTLCELFTGNRQRFESLWIGQSDYDFKAYPTLFLTLSGKSNSPSVLENQILKKLKIATPEGLTVLGDTSDEYFGNLIKALHAEFKSKVAVLIDEYDAPVTDNLANFNVAEANRVVLRCFFTVLKSPEVLPYLRFSMITGITRYALTSLDSGHNHFDDISLEPEYAGICGFTLEEFEALFADRLEETLIGVKDAGFLDQQASLDDLKAEIFDWYDGYNWGGKTRVLNPYTILHFFANKSFDKYWVFNGRPGHLSSLIKKQPLDCLPPNLKSYLSTTVRSSDINNLEAVPALFHSGYLTLDKVTQVEQTNPKTGEKKLEQSFSFQLPNFEVSSAYYRDCFEVIFDLKSSQELENKGYELREAFLSRNAMVAQTIFSDLLGTIFYRQRPDGEEAFHRALRLILWGLGLEARSEPPGTIGRLDLAVNLGNRVYGLIELKFCPNKKLKPKEEDKFLAVKAVERLPKDEVDTVLANLARRKLKTAEIRQILSPTPPKRLTKAEANHLLAQAALTSLTEGELKKTLAKVAREKLSPEEIAETFQNAISSWVQSEEEIDNDLSMAAHLALTAIKDKDYHAVLKLDADEFIDQGMAVYGYGKPIKVVFAPKPSTKL